MKKAERKTRTSGLVLGKFLPPHMGHRYLIDFAQNYVDDLVIILGARPTDPIPGHLRKEWLTNMFPKAKVITVSDTNPEETHPKYWQIWEKTLRKALPKIPDYVFASEDYGFKLAEMLGMKYIPVDHNRELFPVSATKIMQNPMENWNYIPSQVRPYFLKRICIYGPESTGKTVLTKKLAKHFNTIYVHEYARSMLELKDEAVSYSDIPKIINGQYSAQKALETQANKVLFCDTDLLTTTVWSNALFNKCPKWMYEKAERINFDLYLVLDVDVPFVEEKQRYFPKKRKWFLNKCLAELKKRKRKYVVINGDWDERFKKAAKETEKILNDK